MCSGKCYRGTVVGNSEKGNSTVLWRREKKMKEKEEKKKKAKKEEKKEGKKKTEKNEGKIRWKVQEVIKKKIKQTSRSAKEKNDVSVSS